jgi:hypothetical protein
LKSKINFEGDAMKRLALIGILCLAAGTLCAQSPTATQPVVVNDTSGSLRIVDSPATTQPWTTQWREKLVKERRLLGDQKAMAQAKLEDAAIEAEHLRTKLVDATGRSDKKGVMDAIRELEDTREKALLAAKVKQARQDLLEKKIAQISLDIFKKVQTDRIAEELEKIVKMKETDAKRLAESGAASEHDVDMAQTEVANARIRLMERREAIETTVYGDTLQVLNKELVEVSLDGGEQAVLAEAIDARLGKLREGSTICDALDNCHEEISRLRRELEMLGAKEQGVEDQLELQEK